MNWRWKRIFIPYRVQTELGYGNFQKFQVFIIFEKYLDLRIFRETFPFSRSSPTRQGLNNPPKNHTFLLVLVILIFFVKKNTFLSCEMQENCWKAQPWYIASSFYNIERFDFFFHPQKPPPGIRRAIYGVLTCRKIVVTAQMCPK